MKKARDYQSEAALALYNSVKAAPRIAHPVAAIPTGAGKTVVMCEFIDFYLSDHPLDNILVLSHVKEILEQNFDTLEEQFEGINIGLYSAGLHSRTHGKITVAGIQSVFRRPEEFAHYGVVIIDECHLVNTKESGMYRDFLDELNANYVGLTATHFRTGHGYIHKGEGALFNELVYDKCNVDGINDLIERGFLSPLYSKGTKMKLRTSGLKTRGFDFVPKEMSERFDRASITAKAVDEVIEFGDGYSKWLVFAIDIDHANHIAEAFRTRGIETGCVHSKMEGDRSREIARYKRGDYRCMVNVDVLTTGFDAPDIDLIAMLRPTESPIIHVQSLGRGMRVSDGKDHCLVLDFAGNVARLGPVNDVVVTQRGPRDGIKGEPRMKECPKCQGYLHIATKICDYCGYEYPAKEKLKTTAYDGDIIRERVVNDPINLPEWHDVDSIQYSSYSKFGSTPTMRVSYRCGLKFFHEHIGLNHTGRRKHQADNWVRFRSRGLTPSDVATAVDIGRADGFLEPKRIKVRRDGKWVNVVDVEF